MRVGPRAVRVPLRNQRLPSNGFPERANKECQVDAQASDTAPIGREKKICSDSAYGLVSK